MKDDLIERLRYQAADMPIVELMHEAADALAQCRRLTRTQAAILDQWQAELAPLRARIAELEGALRFFRSVIQSGEGWTESCEKAYRAALERKP